MESDVDAAGPATKRATRSSTKRSGGRAAAGATGYQHSRQERLTLELGSSNPAVSAMIPFLAHTGLFPFEGFKAKPYLAVKDDGAYVSAPDGGAAISKEEMHQLSRSVADALALVYQGANATKVGAFLPDISGMKTKAAAENPNHAKEFLEHWIRKESAERGAPVKPAAVDLVDGVYSFVATDNPKKYMMTVQVPLRGVQYYATHPKRFFNRARILAGVEEAADIPVALLRIADKAVVAPKAYHFWPFLEDRIVLLSKDKNKIFPEMKQLLDRATEERKRIDLLDTSHDESTKAAEQHALAAMVTLIKDGCAHYDEAKRAAADGLVALHSAEVALVFECVMEVLGEESGLAWLGDRIKGFAAGTHAKALLRGIAACALFGRTILYKGLYPIEDFGALDGKFVKVNL